MRNPTKTHMGQHIILVIITYVQMSLINDHADVPREATGLNVGLIIHFSTYFMYASSECSGVR